MRIPTGCFSIDKVIGGGFPTGKLSLVYGEAATGKTTIAIQCAVNCARRKAKSIYIDSDGTLFPTRLAQICKYDKSLASFIFVFLPRDFEEQSLLIERLDDYITPSVAFVVVDTISSLYRLELGPTEKTFKLNRGLNSQLAYLSQLAKERGVAILVTSQVHSPMGRKIEVEPVANRLLKFWADLILRIEQTPRTGVREIHLEKYPGLKRPTARCFFRLSEGGVEDLAEH